MNSKQKILILGAGIAGMYAAERLAEDQDSEVTLLEATGHLGGRCFSFFDEKSGETIDNGQHLFAGAYSDFFDFLTRCDAMEKVNGFGELKIPFYSPAKGDEYNLNLGDGSKSSLLFGILGQSYFTLPERLKLLKTARKLISMKHVDSSKTVAGFLHESGQTELSMRAFWSPLTIAILNTSPLNAPLTLLASALRKMFSENSGRPLLMFPTTNYADLFANYCRIMASRHAKIEYQARVKRIIINDGLAQAVELENGDILHADIIVSALPYHALRKVLSDDILALPGFKNLMFYRDSQILSAYLWYDKPIKTPAMFAFLNSAIQWGFNRRRLQPSESKFRYPSSFAFTVSDADSLKDVNRYEIADLFSEILGDSMFEFKGLQPAHCRVIRSYKATFEAYPELEKYRIEQETEIPNFVLCGDWTQTGLPATIEGAARSGRLAVEVLQK